MCSRCPSLVTSGLAYIVGMICVRIHRSNGLGRSVICGQGTGANAITSVEGGGGRARANNVHSIAYCNNDGPASRYLRIGAFYCLNSYLSTLS